MGKRGKEVWLSGRNENRNGGLEKGKVPWRVCECKGKPGLRKRNVRGARKRWKRQTMEIH